ncbi:MAG: thioredoxin family protein [bacterium]
MKFEILGTGCPKCKKLAELAGQAVKESGIEAEITKVTEIKEIMNRGVMLTPALVIDGEVKSAGKVPGLEEIKNWLKERQNVS